MGNSCRNCMTRTPFSTLIATILCLGGSVVFCTSFFRGVAVSKLMIEQVFHFRIEWLQRVQLAFVIIGAVMGAIGLMILFIGVLTTGETRSTVYRAWQSRVGGRISCAVFIVITYLFELIWLGMFGILFLVTVTYDIFCSLCTQLKPPYTEYNCIDFTQFNFLFPINTKIDDMKVCNVNEVKPFCKDYVYRGKVMFFIATIASGIVIMSLAHYLMCLSANYAHIKDHKKLKDYQDIFYYKADTELTTMGGKYHDRYEDEGSKLYLG